MVNSMIFQKLSNRKIIVDFLAVFFGIGAWAGINGIYVQLPILFSSAPEGWDLGVYIVVIVQFANIGPFLYTLYNKYSKWGRDHYIIYGLLATGSLSLYILAFVYDKTTVVFGREHSVILLSLTLVSALVGCTSSVLFMPYMRNYREIYLVSYLVGEGLSSFLPSTIALIQGVKDDTSEPRFSPKVFFIFLGSLLLLGLLSFIGLNQLKVAKRERVKSASAESMPTDVNAPPSYKSTSSTSMSKQTYVHLLVMMAVICSLGNAFLPGIKSYSCLPYGNDVYHLTVTLSAMASPLAMSAGFFIKKVPKVKTITYLFTIFLLLTSYVIFLAIKSPNPPLKYSWLGKFLAMVSWILVNGFIGFIKMSITSIFRQHPGKGLYYTGIITQCGSFMGAIASYLLVTSAKIFHN